MSVYFITARELGRVKIGFTAGDPRARKADLQTGCPSQLQVEAVIDGDEIVEAALHRRFAEHRVVGEWFLLTDEIEQIIAGAPAEWRPWTAKELSAEQLLQFIERLESLEKQRQLRARELADVYAEAKSRGLDRYAIKIAVKLRKERAHLKPAISEIQAA